MMRLERLSGCLAGVVLLAQLTGCAHGGLCAMPLSLKLPPPWIVQPADLSSSTWAAILLRGFDRDCTGAPLAQDADPPLQAMPQPDVQLQPYGTKYLVWLKTHRSDNHQIGGPLAVVDLSYDRATVDSLGYLQLAAGGVDLAVVDLATGPVVRATSQGCDTAPGTATCRTQVQFMGIAGQRLLAAQGAIDVARRELVTAADGAQHDVRLTAEIEYAEGTILVHETVWVEAVGSRKSPIASPQLLRQSEATRQLHWDKKRWTHSGQPLWEAMRRTAAHLRDR